MQMDRKTFILTQVSAEKISMFTLSKATNKALKNRSLDDMIRAYGELYDKVTGKLEQGE